MIMLLLLQLLGCVFVQAVYADSSVNLPDFVTPCRRNDPNLNDCFRKNFDALIPRLKDGIPELNITHFNPFILDRLDVELGNVNEAIYAAGMIQNLSVYGVENAKLVNVDVNLNDPTKMYIRTNISCSHIKFQGNYQGKGKILLFTVNARGKFFGDIYDGFITSKLNVKTYKREGVEYFKTRVGDIDGNFENAKITFTNLFKNNEELTNTLNGFVNENIKDLTQEFKPIFANIISPIIDEIFNKYLKSFPAEVIHPRE